VWTGRNREVRGRAEREKAAEGEGEGEGEGEEMGHGPTPRQGQHHSTRNRERLGYRQKERHISNEDGDTGHCKKLGSLGEGLRA
jgi:hypothetical protein